LLKPDIVPAFLCIASFFQLLHQIRGQRIDQRLTNSIAECFSKNLRRHMELQQIIVYGILFAAFAFYFQRWRKNKLIPQYEPKEVEILIKQAITAVLLDVRSKEERSRQSIRGSIHIPLAELSARLTELNSFKGKEIICYCQSGRRSASAAQILYRNGFKSANMKGGITAWNSDSLG
jgi:rhodanese-related sulfurtransferase